MTLQLADVTARTILEFIFRENDLTYGQWSESFVISTPDGLGETALVTVVYPIGHLLVPDEEGFWTADDLKVLIVVTL